MRGRAEARIVQETSQREARAGAPEGEMAKGAALFRHSDEAGGITGVSLAVDGGEGVSWGS